MIHKPQNQARIYPTFTPSSTVDERQPWTTSSFSRASSNHDRRQPSYSDISEPTLQNRRSVDSAETQPLSTPPVTGPQGTDADDVAFDPQDILQEGLAEWHDRALSIRTLKKTSSIAAATEDVIEDLSHTVPSNSIDNSQQGVHMKVMKGRKNQWRQSRVAPSLAIVQVKIIPSLNFE